MATHQYLTKENYYSVLLEKPKGWQLIFDRSIGVSKNDLIEVIELDVNGFPTGNSMLGTVVFDVTNNHYTMANNQVLVYVVPN